MANPNTAPWIGVDKTEEPIRDIKNMKWRNRDFRPQQRILMHRNCFVVRDVTVGECGDTNAFQRQKPVPKPKSAGSLNPEQAERSRKALDEMIKKHLPLELINMTNISTQRELVKGCPKHIRASIVKRILLGELWTSHQVRYAKKVNSVKTAAIHFGFKYTL